MARQSAFLVLALAMLAYLVPCAHGQLDGVKAEPKTWGRRLDAVKDPAPSRRETYKGILIRLPNDADSWLVEVKAAIDTTEAELANFGIKLCPNMTVYLTGSPEEYAKIVGKAYVTNPGWWASSPDRLVAHRGPGAVSDLVGEVVNGIVGISAMSHQGQAEKIIPEWLMKGLQTRALLANAARIVGVPESETAIYKYLVSRMLDAVERDTRATGLEMLADKYRRASSTASEVELPASLLHAIMPLIMPPQVDKVSLAKRKALCELVATLVKNEREAREHNPQELRGVAQQLVKTLKLEEWFKDVSKDPTIKQQLASRGIDIDSAAFKAAMKDTEVDFEELTKKAGKKGAKPPEPGSPEARFSGGRYGALFEIYVVYQAYRAGENLKATGEGAGTTPTDPGDGKDG